nr:hypothetical protein [Nocardia brasiliensis]
MSSNLLILDAVPQGTPRLFQKGDVLGLFGHLRRLRGHRGPQPGQFRTLVLGKWLSTFGIGFHHGQPAQPKPSAAARHAPTCAAGSRAHPARERHHEPEDRNRSPDAPPPPDTQANTIDADEA